MNEQELKALKALVLVQGAVIQALSWKLNHGKEMKGALQNSYAPILRAQNQMPNPDKEFIAALEKAHREITGQLALM